MTPWTLTSMAEALGAAWAADRCSPDDIARSGWTYTHVLDPATGRYHDGEVFTGNVRVAALFSVDIELGQI